MEVTVGGVASTQKINNPSTTNTSLLYLKVLVNNKQMRVMLDTGANRSFVSSKALTSLPTTQFINKSYKRVILADGFTSLSILGTCNLSIIMGEMLTTIEAFVVKELCADCILGMDFLNKYKLIINTEEQMVSLYNNQQRVSLKFDFNKGDINYPTRLP